jgi:hypothetical protein
LPNRFERILSSLSQSIAYLANGLGRNLDSQTQSVGVGKGGYRNHTRNPRKHCQVPGREAVTAAVPEVAVYEDAPLRLRLETFV